MFPNNEGDTATGSAFQFAIQLERFGSQMCVTRQAITMQGKCLCFAPEG